MRINKMPVRPQAAPETKRDKENGREARQGKPKIGAYGRGPKKRRPYTGNSKKYFKKDVTMQQPIGGACVLFYREAKRGKFA